MTDGVSPPKLPPRALIRAIWTGHRLLFRATGGKAVLSRPEPAAQFGLLRLHTTGRRSGAHRVAILGYIEHDGAIVTLAMNGWDAAEPAWWLNLRARPEARVDLPGGTLPVRARAAIGEERDHLWSVVQTYQGWGDIPAMSQLRDGRATTVVVLDRV